MPEFRAVTFSGDNESLFSPDEVKRLMRSECARATRYKYPVTAMRIAVDRLDQLGDLYGYESRDSILDEVTGVIRRNTRESDFLGYKIGGTFHAIFPHTEEGAGPALAGRLLKDTAKLMFEAGTARVQVTLSVGISYHSMDRVVDFDTIMAETSAAIDRAVSKGGGRFEVYEAPKPVLESLPPQADNTEKVTAHLSSLLDRKLAEFFESMGQAMPDFGGKDREVLALAVKKMEEEHALMRDQHVEQVDMLKRRLNKVSSSLEESESVLRHRQSSASGDSGVASIYRTVQGLADVEEDLELKKEMMSKIFEANLELRSQSPPSNQDG